MGNAFLCLGSMLLSGTRLVFVLSRDGSVCERKKTCSSRAHPIDGRCHWRIPQ
jgi:hypothetical protein